MDKKRLVDGTTALAEKRPRVIKIEPAERPQNVRLRVAAYTRVSSDSEDQLNSFAAQNRYYTELISGKAEWRFFTMGGAKSHDTEDGILEPGAPDFERKLLMLQRKPRARYRINHISWWAQEMPSEEEYAEARKNLAKVDWAVDYVITHCAPTSIALMENRHNEADPLTDFLQEVKERAHYHYWLFGHYHDNRAIDEKHILLWEQIVQVI